MKRTPIPAAAFLRPSMTNPLSHPGIRFLEGDGSGPDGPQGAAPGEGGEGGQGSESGAGDEPGEGEGEDTGSKADDPKLRAARDEAAQNRIKAKEAKDAADAAAQKHDQLIQTLGKALGLVKEDDKGDGPDAEALAAQVAQSQEAATESARELAIYKAAGKAGADPEKLLDSRRFLSSVADLDHTDEAAVKKAVEDAVKDNKSFALGRASGASTADTASGPGGGSTPKAEVSLEDALASHYSN